MTLVSPEKAARAPGAPGAPRRGVPGGGPPAPLDMDCESGEENYLHDDSVTEDSDYVITNQVRVCVCVCVRVTWTGVCWEQVQMCVVCLCVCLSTKVCGCLKWCVCVRAKRVEVRFPVRSSEFSPAQHVANSLENPSCNYATRFCFYNCHIPQWSVSPVSCFRCLVTRDVTSVSR